MSAQTIPEHKILHLPGSIQLVNLPLQKDYTMNKQNSETVSDQAVEMSDKTIPSDSPKQGTKRPAPSAEGSHSPSQNPKRTRNSKFNPLLIKKKGYNFTIAETITKLRTKTDQPHNIGMALGVMLYYIPTLLSTHLENSIDYQNDAPRALQRVPDFVSAVDQYISYLRLTDGCSQKFPNNRDVYRKGRRPRQKYVERYAFLVEKAYKECVCEELGDVFQAWSEEQTRLFNKGVDKALSGIQWVVYPSKNVVLEASEGEWAIWLRGQCEELGMREARAGRKVLEEM